METVSNQSITFHQTKLYKYQRLIDIAASRILPTDNTLRDRLLSVPFLNPHEKHVFTYPVSTDSPYFISYKYGLSKHPHDRAVQMLMKDPQLVDLYGLIRNPNPKIAPLLEQYLEQFEPNHWYTMCGSNHKVILEFLEKHTDKIDDVDDDDNLNLNWRCLSGNKHEIAIRILKKNRHKIDYNALAYNPSCFEIIQSEIGINWDVFALNTHPDAIRIIEENLFRVCTDTYWYGHPEKINYLALSQNASAFHILLENPHFIHFDSLLRNPSENAIAYIEANAPQITDSNIRHLIENPKGLSLVEKLLKQGQISEDTVMQYYFELVMNPSFFDVEVDYQEMSKKRSYIIYVELTEKAFHPSRVSKWLDYYCENSGTIEDFEM